MYTVKIKEDKHFCPSYRSFCQGFLFWRQCKLDNKRNIEIWLKLKWLQANQLSEIAEHELFGRDSITICMMTWNCIAENSQGLDFYSEKKNMHSLSISKKVNEKSCMEFSLALFIKFVQDYKLHVVRYIEKKT